MMIKLQLLIEVTTNNQALTFSKFSLRNIKQFIFAISFSYNTYLQIFKHIFNQLLCEIPQTYCLNKYIN